VVEHQAHIDTTLDRGLERRQDRGSGAGIQPQVIDRDVEGLRRTVQEASDSLGDRVAALATVGQKVEVERWD
jgi:hypothetical protein